MTVIPATMTVKVAPFQTLQYDGVDHTAGEDGILTDMPYDTARLFIANGIAVAHDNVAKTEAIADIEPEIVPTLETPVEIVKPADPAVETPALPDAPVEHENAPAE